MRRRCGHPISPHRVCCCYVMRGFQHCRHHLTKSERAWKAELDKRSSKRLDVLASEESDE